MGPSSSTGLGRVAVLAITAAAVLIVIVALAAFTKGAQRARESEAKQNLHAIQLALEKYGTDHEAYPAYLIGGEARYATRVDPAAKPRDGFFADIAECAAPAQVSDPLLRNGYLTAYPRNPFLRDGREVYRAQQKLAVYPLGGDPLRCDTLEAQHTGTRFGARCDLMGEVLADPRYTVFSAGGPDAPGADKRPSYANVEYQFWDIWQGGTPKPYLPGEFLYKSAGMIFVQDSNYGERVPLIPYRNEKYILGVYADLSNKGGDVLADEENIEYRSDIPLNSPLIHVWPWTRSTNQPGKLSGSPMSTDYETESQIGYGNWNGIRDGVFFVLTAGEDYSSS